MVFLKRLLKDTTDGKLDIHVSEHANSLTIKELLKNIFNMRQQLADYLSGKTNNTQLITELGDHNTCSMYIEAQKKYSDLPEFENFKQIHINYHECVNRIIQIHNNGDSKTAKKLLNTDFTKHSQKMKLSMVKLSEQAFDD